MSADKDRGIRRQKQKRAKQLKKQARGRACGHDEPGGSEEPGGALRALEAARGGAQRRVDPPRQSRSGAPSGK